MENAEEKCELCFKTLGKLSLAKHIDCVHGVDKDEHIEICKGCSREYEKKFTTFDSGFETILRHFSRNGNKCSEFYSKSEIENFEKLAKERNALKG